jgi:hypothetical protein
MPLLSSIRAGAQAAVFWSMLAGSDRGAVVT